MGGVEAKKADSRFVEHKRALAEPEVHVEGERAVSHPKGASAILTKRFRAAS